MPFLSPGFPVPAPVAAEVLAALFEVSLTGVVLLRPLYAPDDPARIIDLAYVRLNPAAQRVLQLPECPAESFLTLHPDAAETGIFAFHCATFHAGVPGRYSVNYQHAGLDNHYHLAGQRSGELLVLSLTDTSDHDRSSAVEQALRTAEAREQAALATAEARQKRETQRQQLEELFMQAPAPIVILAGSDLVFQLVNPAYQHIFPGRELVGKALLDALPELADTPIPELLRRVYATGEPYTDHELPLRMARHHGAPPEEIYWTFTYQARRDSYGAVDGVRVFAHDVSPQVQARQLADANRQQVRGLNQQLAALNDKLYAANAALADANEGLDGANQELTRTNTDLDGFIYAASHDLRTPIANVEGLLLALRDELPPATPPNPADPVQPLLAMMLESVQRFQTTLGQLTDIVRLHDAPAPTESVDLATLIADIRLDLAPQLAAANARLTTELEGCPRLTFAPRHLRSIVYNLLSNAVKYRHPRRPPVVHLRCNSTATTTVLDVQDNGLGLSPTQQGQLFGLFRRLHSHVEGAGVGLYTLKKIVENVGGTVTVHSVLGEGSTFTVTLPISEPATA